jgi:hypothetical protein
VPSGDFVDLTYEHLSPGLFLRSGIKSTTMPFEVEAETIELTRWLLMPEGGQYESFELIRYETASPSSPKRSISSPNTSPTITPSLLSNCCR